MTSIDLEYAEKRMHQKWHDLVMEEQRGASVPMLERMFNAYMLSVEEYNRCVEVYSSQHGEFNHDTKKKAS
jgi:hypothetical protein